MVAHRGGRQCQCGGNRTIGFTLGVARHNLALARRQAVQRALALDLQKAQVVAWLDVDGQRLGEKGPPVHHTPRQHIRQQAAAPGRPMGLQHGGKRGRQLADETLVIGQRPGLGLRAVRFKKMAQPHRAKRLHQVRHQQLFGLAVCLAERLARVMPPQR